jgi:hypothetical protein
LKFFCYYYIFVYISNLGEFWKGGGHGPGLKSCVSTHTYHHVQYAQCAHITENLIECAQYFLYFKNIDCSCTLVPNHGQDTLNPSQPALEAKTCRWLYSHNPWAGQGAVGGTSFRAPHPRKQWKECAQCAKCYLSVHSVLMAKQAHSLNDSEEGKKCTKVPQSALVCTVCTLTRLHYVCTLK